MLNKRKLLFTEILFQWYGSSSFHYYGIEWVAFTFNNAYFVQNNEIFILPYMGGIRKLVLRPKITDVIAPLAHSWKCEVYLISLTHNNSLLVMTHLLSFTREHISVSAADLQLYMCPEDVLRLHCKLFKLSENHR